MKRLLFLFILFIAGMIFYFLPRKQNPIFSSPSIPKLSPGEKAPTIRLQKHIGAAKDFANRNDFSENYQFLIDMTLPSGKNRFFVYDATKDLVIHAGLVAHGSCRTKYLEEALFSNVPECGCSSVGKYKIGYPYEGQFGKAFKLHGLDSTNSNAFKRNIVLHAYECVPDKEVEPYPICNSLGCPMVSYKFLDTVAAIIDRSKKPILLWIFN